jgi:hypothetical protein
MTMTPETKPRHSFYAMPDSPHLTSTYLGYTLMTLDGLSIWTTSKEIERITLNGVDHKFKVMGERALMLIPSFRQEAQTVKVYCKGDQLLGPESRVEIPAHPTHLPAPAERRPDTSTGLSPATHNRYLKEA